MKIYFVRELGQRERYGSTAWACGSGSWHGRAERGRGSDPVPHGGCAEAWRYRGAGMRERRDVGGPRDRAAPNARDRAGARAWRDPTAVERVGPNGTVTRVRGAGPAALLLFLCATKLLLFLLPPPSYFPPLLAMANPSNLPWV